MSLPLIGGFLSLMDPNSFSYIRDRLNIVPMMWDQQENYRHNGFLLAFAMSASECGVPRRNYRVENRGNKAPCGMVHLAFMTTM